MKRKIYFFQVNYSYGKAAHIPYTAGQISAYAFADAAVAENYCLERIFFLRENVDRLLEKIENPSVVAFSTYIWNCNFNKEVAKRIKEKYPDCAVIFGGHHVAPGGGMLEECPYIDYLLHGEGEVIFRRLLRALIGLEEAAEIPGISMRTENGILTNPEMISTECDFPSPYTGGYFDTIIAENPEKDFMALIETSRGCPNSCAYCDWSSMKSRIRKFPLERVYSDIEWVGKNGILGLGSADSNFGMFERDDEITDKIIETKRLYGRPIGLQTSYEKNSNKRVFEIGMKLEKAGMSKGITLSLQSMDETVLENIGRKNIGTETFSELMELYNNAGVATYTELILGLPGETVQSLVESLDKLLNLGQHNSIYIHNCEWLPCSIMGQKDYVERYKIKRTVIALNQPHRSANDIDEIPEYSSIVTSTYSMTNKDWKLMNIISAVVQACHHMGLLQFFALYLYNEGMSSYKNFYCSFVDYFYPKSESAVGRALHCIEDSLDEVLAERGTLSICDLRFGDVLWTFEEYLFLSLTYEAEEFYSEVNEFLGRFGIDGEIFNELMRFQRNMTKQPFDETDEFSFSYDFLDYFRKIVDGKKAVLEKVENTVSVETKPFDSWEDFARVVAWFSRKDGKSTYFRQAKSERSNL
ncbi:MAG: radical SAM protein [Clostridia bacterium]|nr:radical SAM protein [Clostridia bacterium]